MRGGVPEEIYQFALRYLDSVEQLEILLLLFRNAEKDWSIDDVSREIRTSKTSTENRLGSLLLSGLVASRGEGESLTYRYMPASAELHHAVTAIEQEYKIRRIRIIDAIYAPPAEKMMNFVDAFKIRKTDHDD